MSNTKNVEAFEKLAGICAGYGTKYNPAQQNLRNENLSAILNRGRCALKEVGTAKTDFENATNAREVAFKDLDKLGVRILATLRSGGVMSQTISDANSMLRKLRTHRTDRNAVPAGTDQATAQVKRSRTAMGLDYGTLAQNFEKLVQTVSAVAGYATNVPDLTIKSLNDRLQLLRTSNSNVVQALSSLNEARKKRDAVFYTGDQNLYGTAMAVKQQVKAIFGNTSAATSEVNKVRFTKPPRR